MLAYLVEIQFTHSQDDLDMVDVTAESRAEAEATASMLFRRRAWGEYRDPTIVSVTAHERPERRFHLDLGSDSDDLDIGEVRA